MAKKDPAVRAGGILSARNAKGDVTHFQPSPKCVSVCVPVVTRCCCNLAKFAHHYLV